MDHRRRKMPHALFGHPVSADIDPKSVLEALGAELSPTGPGRLGLRLNGRSHAVPETRHNPKEEVVEIRRFLTQAGMDPTVYPP